MKTLIATALILTAGVAQAASFDHERQIGTADLFTTLNSDGAASVSVGGDRNFAYQRDVGTVDLFPTLGHDGSIKPAGERTVFEYQRNIGTQELDPSLS